VSQPATFADHAPCVKGFRWSGIKPGLARCFQFSKRYSDAPIATRGIFDLSPRLTGFPDLRDGALRRVCCGPDRHPAGMIGFEPTARP